jgi:SulP family sulfate permease
MTASSSALSRDRKPAGSSKVARTKRSWLAWLLQPLAPLAQTLRTYQAPDLKHDLLAGLTVAAVDLPQSMAFALVAGVPPIYGLYTTIVMGSLGSLLTSSPLLSVGPTNTQSLLIAAIVSRLTTDPALYLQLVFGLTLLKGLLQLGFAAARMGRLVRYVSRSVMVPFTAAAGVLVVVGQLPGLLGLPSGGVGHHLPGVLGAAQRIAPHLAEVNPRSLGLGAGVLLGLLATQRWPKAAPAPLLAVTGSALWVWLAGWTEADTPLVGTLPHGLPGFTLPQVSAAQLEALLPGALAIALLGMLESVMIGKAIAQQAGGAIDADQEFFGQGLANVVGAFFQCIPGSGSFSRTALQYRVGARTRLAGVFCAGFNALFFFSLAPFARHIPLASLAAILVLIGAGLVDLRALVRIGRASRPDAVVCWVTLLAALMLPLTYAIYVGIFLSLALHLRHASRLHLHELTPNDQGGFEERPLLATARRGMVFVQLEGDLFFALADDLAEQLTRVEHSGVKVAIFRLKRTRWIDASVLFTLERFVAAMHARGGHVLLCGVRPELRLRLRHFGLERAIGEQNVFETEPGVFASAKRALRRAHELVGPGSLPPLGSTPPDAR